MLYQSFDELYEDFYAAKKIYDVDTMSNCLADALECRAVFMDAGMGLPEDLKEILMYGEIISYKLLESLGDGDVKAARFFAQKLTNKVAVFDYGRAEMYYVLGLVNYLEGNYMRAAKYFSVYDECRSRVWEDYDEMSFFYRANCLALLGKFDDAAKFYEAALFAKSNFPEAAKNLQLVRQHDNKHLVKEIYSLWDIGDWRDVPIFINARDRVGVMKKLIDWLLDAGYRNVIILDNDSTYPKLLDYYAELKKNPSVKIILLKKNLGHKALWKSNVLEKLNISTPYVYTDPDVVPVENCPKDFVSTLYEILNEHREFRKVGPSLVWEDITFFDKDFWQDQEARFERQAPVNKKFCYANIDTTFALYTNTRSYSLRFSLRTVGNLRCRHLPWYFDYDNLPDDEQYYIEHANKSSSIAKRLKNEE